MATANNVAAVTPDDDADLPGGICIALEVLEDGDLQYVTRGGSTSAVHAVVAGRYVLAQVARVLETTTATVQALY